RPARPVRARPAGVGRVVLLGRTQSLPRKGRARLPPSLVRGLGGGLALPPGNDSLPPRRPGRPGGGVAGPLGGGGGGGGLWGLTALGNPWRSARRLMTSWRAA